MATADSTIHASTQQGDIEQLHAVITHMDALSQNAFDEIAAISYLAGEALKSNPDTQGKFRNIIIALDAIRNRADGTMNDINAVAETVGCNYMEGAA
jgi:methyl-accepting chemotaxis protein